VNLTAELFEDKRPVKYSRLLVFFFYGPGFSIRLDISATIIPEGGIGYTQAFFEVINCFVISYYP